VAPSAKSPLDELYRRPGFLIRRAQQIAVSLFLEETGALGITSTQYGILIVLKHQPGIDQISLARLLGLDRSTTGMVLGKLEKAGHVGRCIGTHDRRRRNLALTRAGERMLEQLAEPARRAQMHALSPFTTEERAMFLRLLEKFVGEFNRSTRVPLGVHRAKGARGIGRPRRLSGGKANESGRRRVT
jgi:DNA-binding MarR family transcriptional regulator